MKPICSCLALLCVNHSLMFAFSFAVGTARQQEEESSVDDGYLKLAEWVRSNGGRVDQRMSVGKVDGLRGVLALQDIEEGAELLRCPWKLVIGSSSLQHQMTTEEDMCEVVKLMALEFRKGSKSSGWPYLDHVELPRLGSEWDDEAVQELQGLPPSQDLDRHNEWFSKNCGGGNPSNFDEATKKSLISFISRANAVGMTPIYDLLNHHNGLKNAKLFLSEEGVSLKTVRALQKGEQLFLSYGLKPAFQMFRDYGFVEPWPTLWSWKDQSTLENHVFALFSGGVAAIYPSPEFLKDIWSSPHRSEEECQQQAIQYTQSLNPDALQTFGNAAKALLNGLPTSWQQDEVILQQRRVETEGGGNLDQSAAMALGDILEAVKYRRTFKKAVYDAMGFAEQILGGIDKEL